MGAVDAQGFFYIMSDRAHCTQCSGQRPPSSPLLFGCALLPLATGEATYPRSILLRRMTSEQHADTAAARTQTRETGCALTGAALSDVSCCRCGALSSASMTSRQWPRAATCAFPISASACTACPETRTASPATTATRPLTRPLPPHRPPGLTSVRQPSSASSPLCWR